MIGASVKLRGMYWMVVKGLAKEGVYRRGEGLAVMIQGISNQEGS